MCAWSCINFTELLTQAFLIINTKKNFSWKKTTPHHYQVVFSLSLNLDIRMIFEGKDKVITIEWGRDLFCVCVCVCVDDNLRCWNAEQSSVSKLLFAILFFTFVLSHSLSPISALSDFLHLVSRFYHLYTKIGISLEELSWTLTSLTNIYFSAFAVNSIVG